MIRKLKTIKLLDAYEKNDKDIFFGRENEIEELFQKVKQTRLTLLYGLSGTGKTSLIQCGLANKYDQRDWLPLFVRRGKNVIESLKNKIRNEAETLISPQKTIIEHLNILFLDYFKPITLIFDQIEELFISGNDNEQNQFCDFLSEILQTNLNVKIILSLREEYLAYFDKFEIKVPQIFQNRMRLEKMRNEKLLKVVAKMLEKENTKIPKQEIIDQIVKNIADNKGNVELTYLQIYLEKIYSEANFQNDFYEFSENLLNKIGKLDNILQDFLVRNVENIKNEKSFDEQNIWKVLKKLITEVNTKKIVQIEDFKTEKFDAIEILKALQEKRIVKYENGFYELAHDSLADKIAEYRSEQEKAFIEVQNSLKTTYQNHLKTKAFLTNEDITFIHENLKKVYSTEKQLFLTLLENFKNEIFEKEPTQITQYQEAINFALKSRQRNIKNKRLKNLLIFILILLLLASIVFGIYAFQQKNKAERQTNIADSTYKVAKKHLDKFLAEKRKTDSIYLRKTIFAIEIYIETKNPFFLKDAKRLVDSSNTVNKRFNFKLDKEIDSLQKILN